MSSIEYLESERLKLWQNITDLRNLIEKKTADYEQEAKQASRKASEYKNKCEGTKNEALTLLEEIKGLRQSSDESAGSVINLAEKAAATEKLIEEVRLIHSDLSSRKKSIEENIGELEELFANYSSFEQKIQSLEEIHDHSDELSSKIKANYDQLISRKKEIDQLYYGIIGFKDTDPETKEEVEIKGLKHELENAYVELRAGFAKFSEEKKAGFSQTLIAWENEYQSVLQKINSLLPNALTTGLSYAYSQKKADEIEESNSLDKVFKRYVGGLVIVSLIPFAVSLYQLFNGIPLNSVILQVPRLVLSILPLYVPILWVAYSSNRKINLSKRLIEEYTHKEVLSKTFEGLSQQIRDIKDPIISADLKTRLLYNILEVSSENPGKLISDYDKSDHPLMDALDKSVKLTNAVDKISKIPGLAKLADILSSKSKGMLESEDKKATAGLAAVEKSTA